MFEIVPGINQPGSGGLYVNVDTVSCSDITTVSAKVSTVIDTNASAIILTKGVCYGENENISIDGPISLYNNTNLTFDVSISDLTPFKKYYVRSFAKTPSEVVYGDLLDFTTLAVSAPTILEIGLMNGSDTNTSFVLVSNVTSDGGEPGGIQTCGWIVSKTNSTPTVGGLDCLLFTSDNEYSTPPYITGESFWTIVSGLESDTEYYCRSFVTNSNSTAYSSVITQSTLSDDPIILFDDYFENNVNLYTFYGFYNSFIGTATKIGFVYSSVNLDPLLTDDEWTYKYQQLITLQSGPYSADITLTDTDTKTYSVKAFVEQSGTAYYSDITTFTNTIQ